MTTTKLPFKYPMQANHEQRMEILAFLILIAIAALVIGKARTTIEDYKRKEEYKKEEQESEWLRRKQEKVKREMREAREARGEALRLWIQDAIDDWSKEGIGLIQSHKHALAMERKRLVKINPYGIVDDEEWIDEGIPSFVESVLMPSLEKQLKKRI